MVGLIWLIQIVHYPLFEKVGKQQFHTYIKDHQRLITCVVLPLMLVELATSLLLWSSRPHVPIGLVAVGIILVILIWGSTFLIQVPLHSQLLNQYNLKVCRRLVLSNWIRAIGWSLRGLTTAWMVWIAIDK